VHNKDLLFQMCETYKNEYLCDYAFQVIDKLINIFPINDIQIINLDEKTYN